MTRKPGDLPCQKPKHAVGDDGQEIEMTTKTKAIARPNTDLLSIALVAFIGLGVLFTAGFANSTALHDATHDVRHAAGFPCH